MFFLVEHYKLYEISNKFASPRAYALERTVSGDLV